MYKSMEDNRIQPNTNDIQTETSFFIYKNFDYIICSKISKINLGKTRRI
jgi:hypothetical protein